MIKKLINQTKRALLLAGVCTWGLSLTAQSGSFGNTFVFSGREAAIHNVSHHFSTGGGAPLDGIVGTERVSPIGYVSFVGTATHTGASNAAHVDGYVKAYTSGAFTFPIGDNGAYRPARISTSSAAQPATAAYFGVSPSTAITSSLKGGNEPALPSGTYAISSKALNVLSVSSREYWDINGAQACQITLTWNANSNIADITGSSLEKLTIVGWNGTQWIVIPSIVDATSILGGSSTLLSGSMTTSSLVVPSDYDVYTLASANLIYMTNPDIAIGYKGVEISGNVSTNDNVLLGTTYGTPIAAATNPSPVIPVMNANGTYTFTATVPGTYTFTVPVCPAGFTTGCPTETLTVTILDPSVTNNKPIVNADKTITKPGSVTTIDVLANDASGNPGFPLNKNSMTISTAPKNGTVKINPDGTITYTPNPGFVGEDTFAYTICDGATPPNCGSASVVVNVTNEDIAIIQDDVAEGGGILTGNVLSNDKFTTGSKPYTKPQDIVIPGKGRFTIDSSGKYTWTPEPGFTGLVQLVITVCDGKSPETCYSSTLYIVGTNKPLGNEILTNYISPNGDGVNDVWNIDALLDKYPNAKALIYNRWGNIVWRSTGPYGRAITRTNVWSGQSEGSQENVPDGVYYYLLELEDEFKTTKTGFIEVMRQ